VGIGADRYRTGTLLAREFGSDVVLLDDGFQHVKLARNFDLVLVDALNPFGGGEVFPMGACGNRCRRWHARTRL
jgi:tetraacyldisaccharide-1-P 4'-kinase